MDIIGQDGHIYKGRAGAKTSTTLLSAVPKVLLLLSWCHCFTSS